MKPSAAISLTAWLWQTHPEIVSAYIDKLNQPKQLGCFCFDDLSTCFSIDPSDLAAGACDVSSAFSGNDELSCIGTLTCADLAQVPTCDVTSAVSQMCVDVGSELACVPSAAASGSCSGSSSLAKVASSLTTSSGLSSLLNVAASYFKSVAATGQAQLAAEQAAILTAQASRAVAGQSSMPVTYTTGSGGTSAAITTATGKSVPLTSGILSSLTPSSLEVFFAQYGLWVAVAAAAGFVLYAARR